VALGAKLLREREGHGVSQEALALAARDCGLSWSRATVAALESLPQRRRFTLGELILLPAIFQLAFGGEIEPLGAVLRDLGRVQLGQGTIADGEALELLVAKGLVKHDSLRTPAGERWKRFWERARTQKYEPGPDLPDVPMPLLVAAAADHVMEAIEKGARRIGVKPIALAVACRERFGRSLAEERDARVSEAGEVSARTLQALRGHATRAILEEVGPRARELDRGRRRRRR
jgi:hypothetical protein